MFRRAKVLFVRKLASGVRGNTLYVYWNSLAVGVGVWVSSSVKTFSYKFRWSGDVWYLKKFELGHGFLV